VRKIKTKQHWMKKIILAFFLFCNIAVFAQQDPLFTQYMFNKLLVNPAYAGSKELFSIDLLNRTQWVNIDGAPETFTLSAHTAMKNKNVGLGFYFSRDVLGPTTDQSFMGTYAYRLYFGRSSLAFGLQFGIKYFDFNWAAIKTRYPDDLFDPQALRHITPDANFGIYYQSSRMFLGVSSKQLMQNNYGLATKDGKTSFSKLTRHFYMMGGMALPIDQSIIFRPSILAKYTPMAPLQVDLNASLLFSNILWVGASFRTGNAVTLMTEIILTDRLKFGYSYDIYLNELQPYNYGSHEFRLGFEFPLYESRMRTPRYF
jgi:type IX secretion system PorP/SprF family membrane protein